MATGKYGIADQAHTRAVFITDEEGNPGVGITVTGTVNTVGGSGQATVNIAGGFITATTNVASMPTINVGNTVIITGTVNTVGGSGQATVNIAGAVGLTATVNLGSIGTINVGNTLTIGTVPTVNVGNTVNLGTVPTINVGNTQLFTGTATVNVGSALPAGTNVIGTATVNLGAIPTVNIGSSFPTFNVGNTVNLGTVPTVNVGNALLSHPVTVTGNVTATVNLGSIPTVNLGTTITATVNIGSAVPSGPNVIGQVTGRAAITNPAAVADAATVQYMLDKLGRTIVSRAPQDLIESNSILLASSVNTQVFAGFTTLKHQIGTIAATMTSSVAGPSTLSIRDGGVGAAVIYAYTFSGAQPNMPPVTFDPVYANTTASFQITADITASTAGLRVVVTGFKSP